MFKSLLTLLCLVTLAWISGWAIHTYGQTSLLLQLLSWKVQITLWFFVLLWLLSVMLANLCFKLLRSPYLLKQYRIKQGYLRIIKGYDAFFLGEWSKALRYFTRASYDPLPKKAAKVRDQGGQLLALLLNKKPWPNQEYPCMHLLLALLDHAPNKALSLLAKPPTDAQLTLMSYAPSTFLIKYMLNAPRAWRKTHQAQALLPHLLAKSPTLDTLQQLWAFLPRSTRTHPTALHAALKTCIHANLDAAFLFKPLNTTLKQHYNAELIQCFSELSASCPRARLTLLIAWNKNYPKKQIILLAMADLYQQTGCYENARHLYHTYLEYLSPIQTTRYAYCLAKLNDPTALNVFMKTV